MVFAMPPPAPQPESFWDDVGAHFPSLKGAASTRYYLECEQLLLQRFLPKLRDVVLLKTDLWDEAKNTEILRWAAEQGARFARDGEVRRARGDAVPPTDMRLLAALESGLPACAGVALGIDRLLMAMLGTPRIADVLAFDFARG